MVSEAAQGTVSVFGRGVAVWLLPSLLCGRLSSLPSGLVGAYAAPGLQAIRVSYIPPAATNCAGGGPIWLSASRTSTFSSKIAAVPLASSSRSARVGGRGRQARARGTRVHAQVGYRALHSCGVRGPTLGYATPTAGGPTTQQGNRQCLECQGGPTEFRSRRRRLEGFREE